MINQVTRRGCSPVQWRWGIRPVCVLRLCQRQQTTACSALQRPHQIPRLRTAAVRPTRCRDARPLDQPPARRPRLTRTAAARSSSPSS